MAPDKNQLLEEKSGSETRGQTVTAGVQTGSGQLGG